MGMAQSNSSGQCKFWTSVWIPASRIEALEGVDFQAKKSPVKHGCAASAVGKAFRFC